MKTSLTLLFCALCSVSFAAEATVKPKHDGPPGKPFIYISSAGKLGIDPERVITGGGSAGGHISALATMNPGLNDPADPKDIDTRVVAYLWFNPAFAPDDGKDPEINILQHANADLPPTLAIFGEKDVWMPGWNAAHAKWKKLGATTIDLHIAKDQNHGFFNMEPWRTVTLIEADKFLVKQGLLTGEPSLAMPASGEKLD